MRLIQLIFVILLLFSCAGEKTSQDTNVEKSDIRNETEKVYRISLTEASKPGEKIYISDYCQSVQYIPLETNNECLIGRIVKVELIIPYLIVATTEDVFKFDLNGRFIKRIGGKGNGPGEYNRIADIYLRRSDTSIFISSILNKRILQYSLDGNLVNTFSHSLEYPNENIICTEDRIFMSFSDFVTYKGDGKQLMVGGFDNDMSLACSLYSPLPVLRESNITMMLPNEVLYSFDQKLYFKQARNDTLYDITDCNIKPHAIFDLGAFKMPLEEYNYENFTKGVLGGKYIYFQDIVETGESIFFTYKFNDELKRIVYSKTESTLLEPITEESQYFMIDDLNYGLPFWPESSTYGNHLVAWINPATLKDDKLKLIPTSGTYISESDNPVIQLAKIK